MNEPLSETDFQLALAIKRIVKKHGSINNFFDKLREQKEQEKSAKNKEQLHELFGNPWLLMFYEWLNFSKQKSWRFHSKNLMLKHRKGQTPN